MRTVLDASAAVNVVMLTEHALPLVERLEASHIVVAPTLFHADVANVLWKYCRGGYIDKDTALQRFDQARALVDTFEPDQGLMIEAMTLAVRHDHPVYDLVYVVAALRFGAKLLTRDEKLARLAQRIDPSMV